MRRLLSPQGRKLRPAATPGPGFVAQVQREVFTEGRVLAGGADTTPPTVVMFLAGR